MLNEDENKFEKTNGVTVHCPGTKYSLTNQNEIDGDGTCVDCGAETSKFVSWERRSEEVLISQCMNDDCVTDYNYSIYTGNFVFFNEIKGSVNSVFKGMKNCSVTKIIGGLVNFIALVLGYVVWQCDKTLFRR